jgi:hypothetical protein
MASCFLFFYNFGWVVCAIYLLRPNSSLGEPPDFWIDSPEESMVGHQPTIITLGGGGCGGQNSLKYEQRPMIGRGCTCTNSVTPR